jgi:hypothetical protein
LFFLECLSCPSRRSHVCLSLSFSFSLLHFHAFHSRPSSIPLPSFPPPNRYVDFDAVAITYLIVLRLDQYVSPIYNIYIHTYTCKHICKLTIHIYVHTYIYTYKHTYIHTIPYHTIPYTYHTIPCHTIPYHTIPYHTIPSIHPAYIFRPSFADPFFASLRTHTHTRIDVTIYRSIYMYACAYAYMYYMYTCVHMFIYIYPTYIYPYFLGMTSQEYSKRASLKR